MLQELINKLNEAMQSIQSLQIQPTEHNCSQICAALGAIRKAAGIGADMDRARTEAAAAAEKAADGAQLEIVEDGDAEV